MRTVQVLLIGNNPVDTELVICWLSVASLARFVVKVVPNLEEARKILNGQLFDAIVADLLLPDSSNIETVSCLLGMTRVPVIILTEIVAGTQSLEMVKLGAHDFLVKSEVQAGTLVRSLLYAIERQQSSRLREELEEVVEALTEAMKGLRQECAETVGVVENLNASVRK